MRQWTVWTSGRVEPRVSELPMRQWTHLDSFWFNPYFSELPMRQWTRAVATIPVITHVFSELPMRQWTFRRIHSSRSEISELPMRQWTFWRIHSSRSEFSELPMRQWTWSTPMSGVTNLLCSCLFCSWTPVCGQARFFACF